MGRLKAAKIKACAYPPGNHSDGNNLYLRVKDSGARSWVFRYKINGKAIEIGIGSLTIKSLTEARDLAIDMKKAIAAGSNPRSVLAAKKQTKTFAEYAAELIESKKAGWRNAKHAQQWTNTLEQYAFPVIGSKSMRDIGLEDIKQILAPIWTTKTETASRLRMRIEAVIDFGYLHESIDKANPARWKGYLDKIFPAVKKTQTVQHFNAIEYRALPPVLVKLKEQESMASLCILWIALTACRSNEARSMTWEEIDLDQRLWIVPGAKMKAGKAFRVPLNDRCLQILEQVEKYKAITKSDLVFSNQRGSRLSDVAISKLLKSVSYPEATIHGLRSSFKDWAAENTEDKNIAEACLAHSLGAVEAAYQRTELLNKRNKLLTEWGDFLFGKNTD